MEPAASFPGTKDAEELEGVTQLRVNNENFLVASMIDRCPKVMMLRELMKNALETAEWTEGARGRVEVSALVIGGTRKLTIWNTGPGLTCDELFRMCDIASSIRKRNSLDQNFGMGAKVAALPSNKHGIRYRSCTGGRVHEVVLGQRNGVYGRIRRPSPEAQLVDILDVTTAAAVERSTTEDWTEVVLLGNRPEQDTVSDPYDQSPAMAFGWISDELLYRFFRLPDTVDVMLSPEVVDPQDAGHFVPLSQRAIQEFTTYDTVTAKDGTIIHYLYNEGEEADLLSSSNTVPTHGSAGVIFRDEVYMPVRGWRWLQGGPIFGIPFGAAYISVFIELAPTAGVLSDGYRQFLRYASGTQAHVEAAHFAPMVREHRPAWLLQVLENFTPKSRHIASVRNELDALLRQLHVPRKYWSRVIPLDEKSPLRSPEPQSPAAATPTQVAAGAPPMPSPRPPQGRDGRDAAEASPPLVGQIEPAPMIVSLRDAQDLASRGLSGRAARYYPETHQLFINCLYPSIKYVADLLEQELSGPVDAEVVSRISVDAAEYIITLRIGRALVFAMAKRDSDWQHEEIQAAMSPASMSIAADDIDVALGDARALAHASLAGYLEASRLPEVAN